MAQVLNDIRADYYPKVGCVMKPPISFQFRLVAINALRTPSIDANHHATDAVVLLTLNPFSNNLSIIPAKVLSSVA